MKQILKKAPILFLISFSLMGCTSKEVKLLKKIEDSGFVKHLTDAKILFSYEHITGFDSSGPVYYVLDFTDKEKDFLDQFNNKKTGENSLLNGPSDKFEELVNDFVQQWIGMAYLEFKEEYQIDFEKPYSYYCASLERTIDYAIIYRSDTSIANLLYLQS